VFWILEILLLLSVHRISPDVWSLAGNFVSGGTGWGSYFIPVIFQSILVVPFLYFIARRDPDLMVVAALCLNVAFETMVALSGNPNISSLLYPRYLFAGALGVWLVTSTERRRAAILIAGISSLLFITLASYTAFFPSTSIFYRYDGALQFPSFAWTLVLAMAGLKYLPGGVRSRFFASLAGIGKASWHIFLFQMFYFLVPAGYVYFRFISLWTDIYGNVPEPPLLGFLQVPEITLEIVVLLLNVTICVSAGYAWYVSGDKVSRRLAGLLRARREAGGEKVLPRKGPDD
jgi:hypothetical protein